MRPERAMLCESIYIQSKNQEAILERETRAVENSVELTSEAQQVPE